jgi:hypothetical protein
VTKFCQKCQCETERYKSGDCQPCKVRRDNDRYITNKTLGVCVLCSTIAVTGTTKCIRHAQKQSDYQAAKKARGICAQCPNPTRPGQTCCLKHAAERKAHHAKPEIRARERDQQVYRLYGITQAQYLVILAAQGGKCKLCPAIKSGRGAKHFVIDHEHLPNWDDMPPEEKCLHIRGLLCQSCNVSRVGTNTPESALQLVQYITPPFHVI